MKLELHPKSRVDVVHFRRGVILDITEDGNSVVIVQLSPMQAKQLADLLLSVAFRAEYDQTPIQKDKRDL